MGRLTSRGSLQAAPVLHTHTHTHWVSHNQKAWGYVLIILLNSDEILNSLSLRLRNRRLHETKRRHSVHVPGSHVFLHLFRIFQFDAQQAEARD